MVAMVKRADLWGYVQRALLEESRPPDGRLPANTIPLRLYPTIRLRDAEEAGWHSPRNAARAARHLRRLEAAASQGRLRAATRRRSSWLNVLHADRLEHARFVAQAAGLRCDPMGHGPFLDRPGVVYRDRLPWVVEPLSPFGDPSLPNRAAAVMSEWYERGDVFDRFYRAEEPPTSQLDTHCLIGVVRTNGTANWFTLDRWAD